MRIGRKTLIVTIVVAAAALVAVAVVPAIAAVGRGGAGPGWMMGGSAVGSGAAGGVCRGTGPVVDEVATLLGMTPEQIATERQAGKSLAQIAAAKDVDTATLIKTILDSRNAGLDQAVKDGRITQAQADLMTTQMTERVTAMVEETAVGGRGGACFGAQDGDMPCRGLGRAAGGGMMGRGLGRGAGGGCCGGNGTTAPTAAANQI